MGTHRPALAAGIAAAGIAGLYRWGVRPRLYSWGASAEEAAAELPGDALVEPSAPRTTRGITIDAPIEEAWPWLAQLGDDRGPQWQEPQAGDTVWLARRYGQRARQIAAEVVPKSHLVLMSTTDYERVQRGQRALGSWAFYLRPQHNRSRLLARSIGGTVGVTSFDVVNFVIEREMLRGIRAAAGVKPVPLPPH
ncbi:hypothetical protein FHT40_003954 [Mycolicibacterium sp. BK556]|uniref:hypothetical protein n=1 Tax=unclassified Mycolicibacterium TaxID=2636767 RepID=UPI001613ADEF|nr:MULTISPECIES: hypothetical protein [unclassified Mycolicibacterium]MBB3604276.1 hypothetical protein [Mycolicibacterium sp. BK556]MBB3635011.1 hypothetical protein [Mycolicibacterium sp. BK607]